MNLTLTSALDLVSPPSRDVISAASVGLRWRNSFATLDPAFFTRLSPTSLPAPYWVARSRGAARELGLDAEWMQSNEALNAFTGNLVLPGSETLASVYSGHQFGQWAGQLGDGRAILLGEIEIPGGGGGCDARELQLKGAGPTPYSRMGDGRAVLRSSIREFLCSEAMFGLGIPTTRALCVTGSDAPVRREQTETAAVVTRSAPSFIRFGHFEHFSYSGQIDKLRALADYVIDRFYPHCRNTERFAGNAYAALLEAVTKRTADMLAHWQAVGFCHGVMNTDNMSILGLTIDYGPFQFLDGFDPGHICNHSDTQGRYAFNRQPNIGYWNLFCLGQALLPLIGEQELALAALEPYKTAFPLALENRMSAKLGLAGSDFPCEQNSTGDTDHGKPHEGDRDLVETVLKLLAAERVDYTIFWRRLSRFAAGDGVDSVRDLFLDRPAFDAWMQRYASRLEPLARPDVAQQMLKTNPKYVLRNHLGEQAIQKAKLKDFSGVTDLLALLEKPFDEHPDMDAYAGFPPDWASTIEISCSS